jgi:hypothetical protein
MHIFYITLEGITSHNSLYHIGAMLELHSV